MESQEDGVNLRSRCGGDHLCGGERPVDKVQRHLFWRPRGLLLLQQPRILRRYLRAGRRRLCGLRRHQSLRRSQ